MLTLTLLRIRANFKKMLLLLICLSFTVCACSVPPLYSSALVQEMLYSDCAVSQKNGQHPGEYRFSLPFSSLVNENFYENYLSLVQNAGNLISDIPMDVIFSSRKLESKSFDCLRPDLPSGKSHEISFVSYHQLNDVHLYYGEFPQNRTDGKIEVLITKNAEIANDITLGKEYFCSPENSDEGIYIIPVGVLDAPSDGYYPVYDFEELDSSFIITEDDMLSLFMISGDVKKVDFRFVSDWRISVDKVSDVIESTRKLSRWLDGCSADYSVPDLALWNGFLEEKESAEILMILYLLPVLCLLVYVIVTVSSSVVKDDKKEISVLLLRGAHKKQIILSYCLQGLIPNVAAYPIGVLLSFGCVSFFQKTKNFLEFDFSRASCIVWNPYVLFYASAACVIGIVSTVIPCLLLFKKRNGGETLWKKLYIDVLLLAVSLYGWYSFSQRSFDNAVTFLSEPFLFLTVFCFSVGVTLLFIRVLYPLIRSVLNRFGIKMDPRIQIGLAMANDKRQTRLTAITMITVILCLFCANSARTLEKNSENRINYSSGADCVIELDWQTTETSDKNSPLTEKPFLPESMKCSEVTRIITGCKPCVNGQNAKLMGIKADEFSHIYKSRGDENTAHLNEYLNLLVSNPAACIISSAASEKWDVRPGEVIYLTPTVAQNTEIGLIVYAIIDYFPSYDPYGDEPLIVVNSEYIDYILPNLDFDIWLCADKGELDIPNGYNVKKITWREDEISLLENSASNRTASGMLTFLFCVLLVICASCLALFFHAFLKEYASMFSTLKALGMKHSNVTAAVTLLASVLLPFFIAVMLAFLVSLLFIPFCEAAYSANLLVPPTKLYFCNSDYTTLYFSFIVMLIMLYVLIYGTKFGEDKK